MEHIYRLSFFSNKISNEMSRIHFIFNKSITFSYGKHLVNEWCLQDNEMPDIKSFNDAL